MPGLLLYQNILATKYYVVCGRPAMKSSAINTYNAKVRFKVPGFPVT